MRYARSRCDLCEESVLLQALKWYYKKFFLFLSFSFSLSLCFYFFCNSLYLLCSLLSFQFQYFQFFSSYLPWKMSIPSLRNCLPIISAQFFSQWKHISRTFLRLRFTFHSYCHTLYEFGVSFIFFSNSASARQEKQKVSRKKQEERERGEERESGEKVTTIEELSYLFSGFRWKYWRYYKSDQLKPIMISNLMWYVRHTRHPHTRSV